MDNNQLLTASLLDIVFDGRNKEYGAYNLRKDYNKRLNIAMLCTAAVITVLALLSMIKPVEKNGGWIIIPDTGLIPQPPEPKAPEVPFPPKASLAPPPQLKTMQFTSPPKIVEDKDVTADEMPPEMNEMTNARIDLFSKDGLEGDFGPQPPPGEINGVTGSISGYRREVDSIFESVEIESEYPGGNAAWRRYLNKTFRYPQRAIEEGVQGTVQVKFIVDTEGTVTQVEAIEGPPELREEAIRIIKKSGKWKPAIQNGRLVKSYKRQPISCRLSNE